MRALRKRLGLNQTEMAAALGYTSQARVSELEKGHVSVSGPIGQFLAHLDARGPLPVRQAPVEA
ncbi:MAG TPA: helix-turn-helix domain-containing protein [Rubricoccaceae bacterium]